MSILLQFRAIDTHNLTKGLLEQVTNRRITTVSCDRHVRSYERVAPSTARSQFYYSFARSTRTILRKGSSTAPARSQFYYSFARSTRTILRKGSSGSGKIAILLQSRAIDTYDLTKGLHFRKHFPDHGGSPPSNYLSKALSKVLSKVIK